MKQKNLVTQKWILILILSIAVGLAGCQSTQTQSPTATPEPPTATPEPPTPTPEPPTPTPEPPTPTPEPPTATPEPPTPTPLPSPEAPVIDQPGEIAVLAGKKIPVHANAVGAKGYRWELQGDGEISTTEGDTILYIAPEEAEPGSTMALLTVVAYNDQGESPQTSLVINVIVSEITSKRLDALEAIPAGWMSGGSNPADFISLQKSNDCHTGEDCLQVTYKVGGEWGGIYWWPLLCGESGTEEAWNEIKRGTCGINVLEMGNFSTVNRLTFWSRGDQGGEVIEFKIGGVDVEPTPGRSLGKVTLTSTWEQYAIDLEGLNLTNAIGLFLWIATDINNPQGAVFYLDDIQFEGTK
jgi:hypothetical protein